MIALGRKFTTPQLVYFTLAVRSMKLQQIDVKYSFLQVDVSRNKLMEEPGILMNKTGLYHVFKIQIFYVVKQAPRQYFEKFNIIFCYELQLYSFSYDPYHYVKRYKKTFSSVSVCSSRAHSSAILYSIAKDQSKSEQRI